MALTVEEMYQQYAGRAADPGGLAYWKGLFGSAVDTSEASKFEKAIVDARAAGTEPQPVGTPTRIAELYQEVLGRPPESQAAINEWSRVFGDTIDASEYAQFKKEAQVEQTNPALARVTAQILQQGTTGSWSGEGMGSTRANADAMANILTGIGITDINQFGKLEDGSFGNKVTGQAVSNTYGDRQTGDAFGGTYAGKGNTGFRAQFKEDGTPVFYTSEQSSNTLANMLGDSKILNLAANAAATYFGGPLGAGALQLAQGNSLGDAAKAAALAYGAGQLKDYVGGAVTAPGGVDYSLASGPGNGLASMGGAQGLQQSIAGNLDYMGGGQGLTTALGASATSVADAIANFGGVNPANLASMGGGQGFTYQTPSGLVTSSGVLPTGGLTGNNSVVGAGGINTAVSIGGDLGSQLAGINTGVTTPSPGLFGTAALPAEAAAGSSSLPAALSNLTPSQIANIVKAGISIAGLGGGAGLISGAGGGAGGSSGAGMSPTQKPPAYGPEYFNQVQQNFNSYLPQTPRDVATPLQQWYNRT